MQLSVKNVDENIFKSFKAKAVKEKIKLGKALNLAMQEFIAKRKVRPKLNFLDLKPTDWGPGTERLSEQIDEILYS